MRTQVKNYTFIAGTRQITVTDNISFTKADIAIIVNRTQQKVLFTIPDYNLITDVTNKVITYDSSLPVLAENDVLWIEIDIEVTATKIIREDPIVTEVNGEYHPNDYNLVYELAQHIPNDYPHCYIIKIPKSDDTTALNGADAYYTSDGSFYETNQTHTWNDSATNKISRYIIYAFAARDCDVLFSTIGVTAINELMFDDVNVGVVTMTGSNVIISRVWCTDKTTFKSGSSRSFASSYIASIDFPQLTGDAPAMNSSAVTSANFPLATFANFAYCSNIISLQLPSFTGSTTNYAFGNMSKLKTLKVGTLTAFGTSQWTTIANSPNLIKLEIGSNTDIALDLRYGVALTVDNIRDFIVPNLKDNTGLTAKTITFATAVYNNLVAAGYIALFTARNWNVAAA